METESDIDGELMSKVSGAFIEQQKIGEDIEPVTAMDAEA